MLSSTRLEAEGAGKKKKNALKEAYLLPEDQASNLNCIQGLTVSH